MVEDLTNLSADNHEELVRVITFLSFCHTIIIDQKKETYNAASPDELALVNAAKQFGYEFCEKDSEDNISVRVKATGEVLTYQLLNVCEFNSTRKRMSCIYRTPDRRIKLMCKGADSVITDLLSEDSLNSEIFYQTSRAVDTFATSGLRTLYLAEREVSEDEY